MRCAPRRIHCAGVSAFVAFYRRHRCCHRSVGAKQVLEEIEPALSLGEPLSIIPAEIVDAPALPLQQ